MRNAEPQYRLNTPRRRPGLRRVVVLSLALLAAPLVYEWGLVGASRWQAVTGTYWEPRTPILSAIAEWSRTAQVDAQDTVAGLFRNPWKPSLAIPLGVTWGVLMGAVFLRKVR